MAKSWYYLTVSTFPIAVHGELVASFYCLLLLFVRNSFSKVAKAQIFAYPKLLLIFENEGHATDEYIL